MVPSNKSLQIVKYNDKQGPSKHPSFLGVDQILSFILKRGAIRRWRQTIRDPKILKAQDNSLGILLGMKGWGTQMKSSKCFHY
jgi:hypothetical protein